MVYERNCEIKSGVVFPEAMHRIALGVEYAGAGFKGFQRQSATHQTVQERLEHALSSVANESVTLVCAGRTDAGVHATGQVVHFDTLASRPIKAWVMGVNTKLPDEIRVRWAKAVSPQFHARFSAGSRSYRYIFYCSQVRSAILSKQVTFCSNRLDFSEMEKASNHLIGRFDFSAFRSSQCQAHNPVRKVESISWCRQGDLIGMQIKANAFLHHMVRNIVGTLIEVGLGRQEHDWVAEVLKSEDRRQAGPTAAPWGLYLVDVAYPSDFSLPSPRLGPAFFRWDDHSRL